MTGRGICKAFPTGISREILDNKIDHRQPIEGDSNIQWEPDKKGAKHPLA